MHLLVQGEVKGVQEVVAGKLVVGGKTQAAQHTSQVKGLKAVNEQ